MSTDSIFDILEALETTQGSNAKTTLLGKHAGNDLLKEVFQLTQDPYVNFYVAKVPKVKRDLEGGGLQGGSSDSAGFALIAALRRCISKELRGNAARDAIANVLKDMTDLEFKWAGRIITRKTRTGVGDSIVEKIWPGLVPSFEVSLADKVEWVVDENKKLIITTALKYPCRVEPKWDGYRCVAVKVGGVVTMYARSGRIFDRAPTIQAWLEKNMDDDTVFDGELMGQGWNDTAEILGSKKNHKDDAALSYFVFDVLPLDIWKTQGKSEPLIARLVNLIGLLDNADGDPVRIAEGKTVINETELLQYYEECLARGYEGVMLKKMSAPYAFKRCDNVLKLKPIVDYDCVVSGVAEAREQTKWDGMFTILEVRLPEGKEAVTRVGTGTDDEEKKSIDKERTKLIGRPCTVQGQPPISPDGKIRFPRFLKWREEWDCAPEVRTLIKEIKG